MLTPEYLQHAAEGAEAITEDLHNRIMRKIVKAILTRMERGENYMLTAADKWRIEALQEAGYLLEDIQKEIAKATNQQLSEIKSACVDAGIQTLNGKYDKNIDALYDEYIAAKMAYQEHGDAAHKDKLMDSVGRLMVEVFDMLQAMILDADFRDERQAIMQQIRKLADS